MTTKPLLITPPMIRAICYPWPSNIAELWERIRTSEPRRQVLAIAETERGSSDRQDLIERIAQHVAYVDGGSHRPGRRLGRPWSFRTGRGFTDRARAEREFQAD